MLGLALQEVRNLGYCILDDCMPRWAVLPDVYHVYGHDKAALIASYIHRRSENHVILPGEFLKRCSVTGLFHDISAFAVEKSCSGARFCTRSRLGSAQATSMNRARITDINLQIMRFIMQGHCHAALRCTITGRELENIAVSYHDETALASVYNFHHVLVVNNKSLHKRDAPSNIMSNYDLSLTNNKSLLIDLMTTVPLCAEEHAKVHVFANSGLDYFHDRLPRHLQDAQHFAAVCEVFSLDLDHAAFCNTLTLDWAKNYSNSILGHA